MRIVCLDLEGVLVPEIWIEFAERTGIPELRRTTRDEPNYDTLMKYRLDILAAKKLGVPANECAVVEDAVPGIRAALAAGAYAIGVTTTLDRAALAGAGANEVIDSFEQLPRLLPELFA